MNELPDRQDAPDRSVKMDTPAPDPAAHDSLLLRAAQLSDTGAVRERNEDASFVFTSSAGGYAPLRPFGLFLVADGMGGHAGGQQASRIAVRVAAEEILQQIFQPLLRDEFAASTEQVEQLLHRTVLAAHEAVYDPDPAMNGGTTLTMALILGRDLFLGHVGDSRAYWLRDGQLQPITRDHSLVQRLLDNGQLSSAEAQEYRYRNILLRALGQEDDLDVDTHVHALPERGKLLLCSDGLCGYVSDADLQALLDQDLPPDAIAQQLIAAAMAAGGLDNITAVVVEFTH